jgi:type III pantothenate kinase
MALLLDIGNSAVKWAITQQGKLTSTGVFSYSKNNFEDDIKDNLFLIEKPSKIFVSNVAGNSIFNLLNKLTKQHWSLECWQAQVLAEFKELKNSYNNIEQMGIDRWLAMVAAWEKSHSALCLVSCGTALTIDLIDSKGIHLGGYIIPGVELMQKALVNNTAQINIDIKKEASIEYAKNTQAAVNNGAFLAAISMIDRAVDTFTESNSDVKCIISGGMANSINPLLKHAFEYEPNLVLMGLSIQYKAKQ